MHVASERGEPWRLDGKVFMWSDARGDCAISESEVGAVHVKNAVDPELESALFQPSNL
jgi:hypothetical protein